MDESWLALLPAAHRRKGTNSQPSGWRVTPANAKCTNSANGHDRDPTRRPRRPRYPSYPGCTGAAVSKTDLKRRTIERDALRRRGEGHPRVRDRKHATTLPTDPVAAGSKRLSTPDTTVRCSSPIAPAVITDSLESPCIFLRRFAGVWYDCLGHRWPPSRRSMFSCP